KILDFGIARIASEPAPELVSVTTTTTEATGIIMGTLGYMSPEQAAGAPVDSRTDIFSLGVVMFEMLSGSLAFRRESVADTLRATVTEDPPPLRDRAPEVPRALERVVLRCLEKSPGERFQSARDLAFALDAFRTSSGAVSAARSLFRVPATLIRLI